MLQVGGNRAYLYETQSYSQLFSDIEFMIEKNPETKFTLITRIPSRRLLEQLDINGLDTYWMTEQDSNNSIKPDFSSVVEIFRQSKDAYDEQVMVIDGLEFISDRIGADQLLTEITILVDDLSNFNYTCILCLDLLAMPAKIATKLKYILETLEISNEKISSCISPFIIHSAVIFPAPPELTIPILLKPPHIYKFFISGVSPRR